MFHFIGWIGEKGHFGKYETSSRVSGKRGSFAVKRQVWLRRMYSIQEYWGGENSNFMRQRKNPNLLYRFGFFW